MKISVWILVQQLLPKRKS